MYLDVAILPRQYRPVPTVMRDEGRQILALHEVVSLINQMPHGPIGKRAGNYVIEHSVNETRQATMLTSAGGC